MPPVSPAVNVHVSVSRSELDALQHSLSWIPGEGPYVAVLQLAGKFAELECTRL